MREKQYRIKELTLFKNGCDIDFLKSLRSYRCYITEEDNYIAVMQFAETFSVVLKQVEMIQQDGTIKNITVRPVKVQLDKKYSLYEIYE